MLVFLVVFNLTLGAALLFNAPLEGRPIHRSRPIRPRRRGISCGCKSWSPRRRSVLGRFTVSGALLGGILVPGILLALLAVWPFLDRSPHETEGVWFAGARRRQNLIFVAITGVIIVLIFVGVFLRGPYWRLYWPGTPRPVMPTLL